MAVAYTNSKQLWLPVQDQANQNSIMGRVAIENPSVGK